MPNLCFLVKVVAAATLYLLAMPSPAAAERVDDLEEAAAVALLTASVATPAHP